MPDPTAERVPARVLARMEYQGVVREPDEIIEILPAEVAGLAIVADTSPGAVARAQALQAAQG